MKEMERREFIKRIAIGGAVLGLGGILSDRTAAADVKGKAGKGEADPFRFDEADKVVITTVIDNYVDVFLPSSDVVKRWGPPDSVPGTRVNYCSSPPLMAEHGLSLLIESYKGGQAKVFLFDAGFTEEGVPNNLAKLGIEMNDVNSIVISHGHPDHTAAVSKVLRMSERRIPLITHPAAFSKRFLIYPNGRRIVANTFTKETIERDGAEVRLCKDVETLAPGVVATGEIDMTNDFEKGFPLAFFEHNGKMERDLFPDEKSLIINLKGKGLIVLSGCSHRGIINTVNYAKRVTGIHKVHAVIGGFHLTGKTPMRKIERTVAEMKKIGPDFVVPTHCTGWRATNMFAQSMPDSFLLNSVGTRFVFQS